MHFKQFCRFLALVVLFICAESFLSRCAEAKVVSIRTGVQPKGLRLVADLTEESHFAYETNGKLVILVIEDLPLERIPRVGSFPGSKSNASYRVEVKNSVTKIFIDPGKVGMEANVYKVDNPPRIVVDLYPKGETPPFPLKTFYFGGVRARSHRNLGLDKSNDISSVTEEKSTFRIFQEDVVFRPGITHKVVKLDFEEGLLKNENAVVAFNLSYGGIVTGLSYITVFLNGYPEKSFVLEGFEEQDKVFEVPINNEEIKKGINELEILAFLDSPKGWVKISKFSNVTITSKSEGPLVLSDLYELMDEDNGEFPEVLLVMPDNPPLDLYKAALSLALSAKGKLKFESMASVLERSSNGVDFSERNMIFLGLLQGFPDFLKKSFQIGDDVEEDEAFLSCYRNKKGAARFIIASKDKVLLQRVVEFISSRDPVNLPSVATLTLKDEDLNNNMVNLYLDNYLLKIPVVNESVVIRNVLDYKRTYKFSLPKELGKITKSKLIIKFKASPAVSSRKTEVWIEIGGKKKKRKLEEATMSKGFGELSIPIEPKDIVTGRPLDVTFGLKMEPIKTDMMKNPEKGMWVVLDELSLYVESVTREKVLDFTLKDLPYLWVGEKIGIWCVPSIGSKDLSLLTSILRSLENVTRGKVNFFLEDAKGIESILEERKPGIIIAKVGERGKDYLLKEFHGLFGEKLSNDDLNKVFFAFMTLSGENEEPLLLLLMRNKPEMLASLWDEMYRGWNFDGGAVFVTKSESGDLQIKGLDTGEKKGTKEKRSGLLGVGYHISWLVLFVASICVGLVLLFILLSFKSIKRQR